jgi:GT2 family glycosyltransferase
MTERFRDQNWVPGSNSGGAGGAAPVVSVVMPVYNDYGYLAEAIESMLTQTFTDFELVIVDDGSDAQTHDLLQSYATRDRRMKIIRNETNHGVSYSANVGCRAAAGTYIARMDADDISLPDRLARQVAYFEAHPTAAIIGTDFDIIDDTGSVVRGSWQLSWSAEETTWLLCFGCCLCHSSTMARASLLRQAGYYDERLSAAEDFDLYTRLISRAEVLNIPEKLHRYRVHGTSVTQVAAAASLESSVGVIEAYLQSHWGVSVERQRLVDLRALILTRHVGDTKNAWRILRTLQTIFAAIRRRPASSLSAAIRREWIFARRTLALLAVWLLCALGRRHSPGADAASP